MSDHSLPPDPSTWPRDPFRLLGVPPGVSARDLRKAYLRLIRSYKPEHSPEEFKRIRDAYESVLPFARALERSPADGEVEPDPSPSPSPREELDPVPSPGRDLVEPAPDPWEMACRGEPEAAYASLVGREARGLADEDAYLQLYWLLAIRPHLDPPRSPVDWLAGGLEVRGAGSPRIRELLKREFAADPTLPLGDRWDGFFRGRSSPSVVVDLAEARWRAAKEAGRWALIIADLDRLRGWVPDVDEPAWARLLIASATNLAWDDGPEVGRSRAVVRELEELGSRHRDHSEDLFQLEYAQIVKDGLDRLGGSGGPYSGIYRLLAISWDERGPEFRARLRAYVAQLAQGPGVGLQCLDEIHGRAPSVLGRLSTLLGDFEIDAFPSFDPTLLDEISPTLRRFLDTHAWADYPKLRPGLLKFCLREAISPGLVARTMSERAEFILTGKNPLALAILEDFPLRHAYRACEMARETPDEG